MTENERFDEAIKIFMDGWLSDDFYGIWAEEFMKRKYAEGYLKQTECDEVFNIASTNYQLNSELPVNAGKKEKKSKL